MKMLTEAPKKAKKLKYGEVTHAINLDQNLQSVIQNITNELKTEGNKLAATFNLPWRKLEYCNVSFTGTEEGTIRLTMKVEDRKGGFRVQRDDASHLQDRLREIRDVLKNFEKALKAEFKERTGKALKMKAPKEFADFEMVAPNGLYRFYAMKSVEVSSALEEPEYK